MSKFDLTSLLSKKSLNSITEEVQESSKKQELVYISIYDLVPSKDNFYSMEHIQKLKIAIELAGRVLQNLNVIPLENGKYKVIAGHGRRLASIELVEEGKKEYEFLPCIIESTEEDKEIQALNEELYLIVTNSQREKTDYDKVQEVERLRCVLEKLKEKEKIPGRMRELIASILNTSTTQVERMESISKNLTPEFKEEFKNNNVNISTAYELSGLPQEEQQEALQEYKEKGSITIKEVQTIKKNKPAPEPAKKTTIVTVTREEVQEKEPEPVPFERPLNVYVSSPYGGLEENFKKAFEYCKYVAALGHIPFASHVMLHGIFADDAYEQRLKGLQAGFEMIRIVDEVWVFSPEGDITKGMQQEIDLAKQLDKRICYRSELNEQ